MAKINNNHPEYNLYLPYWRQIRTFIKGMKDVQKHLQNVTQSTDQKAYKRNNDYKSRAKYTNFPARTRNALLGAIFRKEPIVDLPSQLEFLITNSNGAGKPLNQITKHLLTNLIEVGRHGVFVDYGDNAKIVTYSAENIIDWSCDDEGVLNKVVLKTSKDTKKHLIIDINGYYAIEIYNEIGDKVETIEPTKADGSRFDVIPFVICGSIDNSPDVDDMPLWSIVDVTQGHYQNSADYEDILRYLIPTPAVTVPNASWMAEMLPNGHYSFGDGSIVPLPDGGNAVLLQASANQMHQEAMKHKEEQLIMLGARIISGTTGQAETAEAARIRYSSENSILDNLVGNAEHAINQAIKWCGEFIGVEVNDDVYQINRDFFDSKLSAQEITAQALLLDRQIIAVNDLRNSLRKTGYIESNRTDEDIDNDIEIDTSKMTFAPNVTA